MCNNEKEKTSMKRAYKIADELLKDRLSEHAPEFLDDITNIQKADVLVTRGKYDFIERVLAQAGTPFTLLDPSDIENAEFRPDQIIFVNCPGNFSPEGIKKLASFVNDGGFLFTTDWAISNVLQRAFPGYVEYNKNPTTDEVVRVEIKDKDDPFLRSILTEKDDPQWWLEGSSYPIKILDREKVRVLVSSKAIKKKYGEDPVFITFEHGQGKVYHMISHFYLQRTETRTRRQESSSETYLSEKGITDEQMAKFSTMGSAEVTTGALESAYASKGMLYKVMIDKKKQMREKDGKKGKEE